MKKGLLNLILVVILVSLGFAIGWDQHGLRHSGPVIERIDTITHHDTIMVVEPPKIAENDTEVKYIPIDLSGVVDSLMWVCDSLHFENCDLEFRNDSLLLALQMTQAYYHEDSLYDAWVSGWHPQLDSIKVYRKESIIIRDVVHEVRSQDRWGLGVTAGFGVCRSGITPYIGVGLTYDILSW